LARLVAGNERFRSGTGRINIPRPELATQVQRPFAIVVGCSDSRTPVEILFDQGFGDLFVVRVAGNVPSPSVVGSVEFAVATFGTTLVMVLGHTQCGAIDATLAAESHGHLPQSPYISFITDMIAPCIHDVVAEHAHEPIERLRVIALHANIAATVAALRAESPLIAGLMEQGRIQVVGAEYALETGAVTLLPESAKT